MFVEETMKINSAVFCRNEIVFTVSYTNLSRENKLMLL